MTKNSIRRFTTVTLSNGTLNASQLMEKMKKKHYKI